MPNWLPDVPTTYGDVIPDVSGSFRQRWLPGAFGDLLNIRDVDRYVVLEDDWHEQPDGSYLRTIYRAKALRPIGEDGDE